jgi:hypothetical protein
MDMKSNRMNIFEKILAFLVGVFFFYNGFNAIYLKKIILRYGELNFDNIYIYYSIGGIFILLGIWIFIILLRK